MSRKIATRNVQIHGAPIPVHRMGEYLLNRETLIPISAAKRSESGENIRAFREYIAYDTLPEVPYNCTCAVTYTNGKFAVKYVNRACPAHSTMVVLQMNRFMKATILWVIIIVIVCYLFNINPVTIITDISHAAQQVHNSHH